MDIEDEAGGHGGARDGAGRPKGRPSLRRAAQAIAEVEEAYPGWSPVLHLAAVANDETLPPEVRLDAAKAAAPYLHSRPKPVEMEPDALVDLERRLIAAKIEAAAASISNPSLADRLARAKAKITVHTGVDGGSAGTIGIALDGADDAGDPGQVIDAVPSSTPRATPDPAPAAYRPVLPHGMPPAAADWAAPTAPWPERPAFADLPPDNPFEAQPYTGDFTDAYKGPRP